MIYSETTSSVSFLWCFSCCFLDTCNTQEKMKLITVYGKPQREAEKPMHFPAFTLRSFTWDITGMDMMVWKTLRRQVVLQTHPCPLSEDGGDYGQDHWRNVWPQGYLCQGSPLESVPRSWHTQAPGNQMGSLHLLLVMEEKTTVETREAAQDSDSSLGRRDSCC